MKIAIVAPPWVAVPPVGYGGTEAVLDGLARGLSAAGHDVLLYTTGDSACPVPKAWVFEKAAGVGIGGAVTELRHVIHAYEAVRGYDIVHDHTLVGPVYAERFPDLAVVTTNHGPFDGDLRDYYRAIGDRVPVIAISHHQASTAGEVPVAGVIHHGINTDKFALGAGRGGYALFLGRMSPDKGVHTAVRVAREAGVPLKIAAKLREQPEHEYFEERVRPLLGGDIEYIGEVAGATKHQLLGDALCLLNPMAWHEPFGMVMIEALASGTPVVATPRGAAPEIVDDGVTGFLRIGEEALAVALGRVGSLDRAACRRAAESRFSLEHMVGGHVDLFERVIRGEFVPGSYDDLDEATAA
ncbi:MAG TPA: glycosyltransferase family 4 protein [Acidimicrobiales bacterium]|nr:glycosyltransferase family 4 protein [Acidimicrobiales bacterium]